jgi:uncharacterized protein (TIGR00251 family)
MTAASTRLTLRVAPGARSSAVVGRHGDAWKVRVAAPPQDGRANDALCRLLAGTLELPVRAVRVVSGHGSRDKVVAVAGIAPDETERLLARAAAPERTRG